MSCWEPRAQWKHLALDALGAEWCGKPPILVRKIAFDLHGRRLSRSAPRASWPGRRAPLRPEDPGGVAAASTWITIGLHVGWPILSTCTAPIGAAVRHGFGTDPRTCRPHWQAERAARSGTKRSDCPKAGGGDRDRSGFGGSLGTKRSDCPRATGDMSG